MTAVHVVKAQGDLVKMSHPIMKPTAESSPMQHPHERQIVACIGNNYVLFGSGAYLPDQKQIGPDDVQTKLSRVGEPRDQARDRVIASLIVAGFEIHPAVEGSFGDIIIVDGHGRRALVEIKVGDRDYAGLDLKQAWEELAPYAEAGERREIWGFNFERLHLGIVWSEGRFAPSFEPLRPLNVWEYNDDGSVFERHRVVEEVDDWVRRVHSIYADVEAWVREEGMEVRRDRTIPMSEEIMQNFAVPDRDMPILDVMADGKPIASLVPSGLWLIGFKGMIDIITRRGTFNLGASVQKSVDGSGWMLIDRKQKSQSDWSREVLMSLLVADPANE